MSETFEVNGSTDAPVSNLLEKGRYKFKVKSIVNHTARTGNKCAKVEMIVNDKKLTDFLILNGQMSWKWRQFLHAIDIRNKATKFEVSKDNIEGREGLVDIGIKTRTYDDNSTAQENTTISYSPIEEEEAPIKGVELEEDVKQNPKVEEKPPVTDDL